MSATLNADRVAAHLGGVHLKAEGRLFPVTCKHLAGKAMLPDIRGLEERIQNAIELAENGSGDILVFLPGKAEIANVERRLRGTLEWDVLTVHGSLTLKEQSRVFEPGPRRRIILSTNVAETSITIPGVGVIVDSGLVRRTRYVNGRGFLTLVPIAMDSADQRAGRAGRLGPGVCYRLWSRDAILEPTTPPEIHREALSPLILAAGACGARADALPFLDSPKDYAVESALTDLTALGAVDENGNITQRGRKLYGLPLDAALGNLLVEAEGLGCIEDAIDLVSVLAVGRPLFTGDQNHLDDDNNLRHAGCDGVALIRAVREGEPERHRLSGHVLKEARATRRRLRTAWEMATHPDTTAPVRRNDLALAALKADPRSAYVARRRKGRVYWGNGGTEVQLSRESAVDEEKTPAVIVLASMALGQGYRDQRIYATCAMPTTFILLAQAGFGEECMEHADRGKKSIVARIERVYAGKVIEKREEVPTGKLARDAIKSLFLNGRLFPDSL
jgi:HrpA-like RNA helicase